MISYPKINYNYVGNKSKIFMVTITIFFLIISIAFFVFKYIIYKKRGAKVTSAQGFHHENTINTT